MTSLRYPPALLALLLSASGCHGAPPASKPQAEGRRVGDYKGFREISESVNQHMIAPDERRSFYLGSYLGSRSQSSYSSTFDGLLALLGGYGGTGANNGVQGGEPNAMTMMLWDTALSGLAADIGALCEDGGGDGPLSIAVDPVYRNTVKPLCIWPAPAAVSSAQLQALWHATLGDEVGEDEQAAWVSGVLAPDSGFTALKGAAAVQAIARSMLLNTHYLLEE